MKRYRSILLALVVIVLAVAWWNFQTYQQSNSSGQNEGNSVQIQNATTTLLANTNRHSSRAAAPNMQTAELSPAQRVFTSYDEETRKTGNVPIYFYGKVIDQYEKPIVDAKIKLKLQVGYLTSPTTGDTRWDIIEVRSNGEGEFSLLNARGSSLTVISIEKEGYELSSKSPNSFQYFELGRGTFHPDAQTPQIFEMWKKAGAEPLIHSRWRGQIALDEQVCFDLFRSVKSIDGTLQITCSRIPSRLPPGNRKPFYYRFQITVLGGGIQTTADQFTYLAPENGYSPNLTIEKQPNDPDWNSEFKQEFYIRTAENQFGRLSVDWPAWQNSPMQFKWECFVNPSGARNLEFDPKKVIKP